VPGAVEARELEWRVRAVFSDAAPGFEGDLLPVEPQLPPPGHAGSAAALPRGAWRAYADADVAGERLHVRAWRPGDRFRPLGLAYTRKLQDVFTDAKIPRDLRWRLPLVCAGEGAAERIVWVAGLRIGDECKLTSATRRTLVLQAEPLDELNGRPSAGDADGTGERER
jgi:tRNA(Ile)-lysidine synthetase-like protein